MLIAAVVVAFATQAGALLPAPWQQGQPSNKNQYAVYGRPEPDGTFSVLTGTRQVCNCKPATLLADFVKDLNAPGVAMSHDTRTICGVSALHLVASGVAKKADSNTQNVDVFIFRKEPAAYILMYRYRYAQPRPDEEKALSALCPH